MTNEEQVFAVMSKLDGLVNLSTKLVEESGVEDEDGFAKLTITSSAINAYFLARLDGATEEVARSVVDGMTRTLIAGLKPVIQDAAVKAQASAVSDLEAKLARIIAIGGPSSPAAERCAKLIADIKAGKKL